MVRCPALAINIHLNFKVKKEEDDIKKVIMNHPDWEIKDFEKLYQERKRYHNSGDKSKL
jgi:hypothetical protein